MSIRSDFGEQLEAYFNGDMKGADRLVFEGRVESDPMLKAEFENQQEIVNSLKAHRVAELKTRLNNINVEPAFLTGLLQNTLVKPVAYGLASLAVVSASYFAFNTGEAIEYHLDRIEGKGEFVTESNLSLNTNMTLDYRYVEPKRSVKIESESIEAAAVAMPVEEKVIEFEVPEVEADLSEDEFQAPGLSIDEAKKIEQVPTLTKESRININTVNSRKYNFHYRIEDNRLFLYGKFNESPYEIIELNTPESKSLYFFYDGYYHHLNKEAATVTRLSRIEDDQLIEQLNGLRSGSSL